MPNSRRLGDLYAKYLGVPSGQIIEKTITTSFVENLDAMWQVKIQRSRSSVVKKTGGELVDEYSLGAASYSFANYSSQLDDVITDVRKSINWDKVSTLAHLTKKETNLVRQITESFDGKDMVSYAMTELFPSNDGELNVEVMDFLLRNAGKEYIESIPAMYDRKTSFGPYQFTEYALYSNAETKEKRGASIINEAITENSQKIPGSVALLRGDDHHRAAYLFAIYNMCTLVRNLNKKEFVTLSQKWKSNKDDLFIFCATAHHLPGAAVRAGRNWLSNGAKYKYEKSCGKSIMQYAVKTRNNLDAI
jgi:hypothetical protein